MHDHVCWMQSFKPAFPLSSFTFIKKLFSSSSLSVIKVVSSAYLRLLIFLQSAVPCPVLTVAPWFAYNFLRRQVQWSGTPISLRVFHILLYSTQSKAFAQSVKQMFFWNSTAFSMIQQMLAIYSLVSLPLWNLFIWKLSVHLLLKPSLEDFEHNLPSMWNEYDCMVLWTFFGIALLWDCKENGPFPAMWILLSFPNLLTYWVQQFI